MNIDSAYSKHGTVMSLPLLTMALAQARDEFKSIEHMIFKDSLYDDNSLACDEAALLKEEETNSRVNLLGSESLS
jgi:hypothetical protein